MLSAPSAPVVLPPLNAPGAASPEPRPRTVAGESRMTLMSPVAADGGDGTDWAVVLGFVLVAEFGLLWGAACAVLWRRRAAFERAIGEADGE
ncbi:hypothetical protein AGRA3207_004330 [Actinomadura graeca]|uniref:Uncharacterized protein n=1 Tax=Actinomadura graeca TaxID=2750812 RepID=A0ABX8R0H4_9ACTN|nr:hypothetical protein [Actinomadura graeca]QXJ23202.1 hypothetical protein AGRA3207_004330 [Actinomadura graeca]